MLLLGALTVKTHTSQCRGDRMLYHSELHLMFMLINDPTPEVTHRKITMNLPLKYHRNYGVVLLMFAHSLVNCTDIFEGSTLGW